MSLLKIAVASAIFDLRNNNKLPRGGHPPGGEKGEGRPFIQVAPYQVASNQVSGSLLAFKKLDFFKSGFWDLAAHGTPDLAK